MGESLPPVTSSSAASVRLARRAAARTLALTLARGLRRQGRMPNWDDDGSEFGQCPLNNIDI